MLKIKRIIFAKKFQSNKVVKENPGKTVGKIDKMWIENRKCGVGEQFSSFLLSFI